MTAPGTAAEHDLNVAWTLALAAARQAERLADHDGVAAFTLDADGTLRPIPDNHPSALLAWRSGRGHA